MREIKFLKDLPIKLTNGGSATLSIVGGDIYYDSEGNRFGYITFTNLNKSPLFAIQLFIKEFDIDGKFIRENEYFEGSSYYEKGEFVNKNPLVLDRACEAIEITIVKLTYNNHNWTDGRFVAFKNEDYLPLEQNRAPFKKPATTGTRFDFGNRPGYQPSNNEVESSGVAPSETPAQQVIFDENINNIATPSKNFFRFIPLIVGVVALAIIVFIYMSTVTGGVNEFNRAYSNLINLWR